MQRSSPSNSFLPMTAAKITKGRPLGNDRPSLGSPPKCGVIEALGCGKGASISGLGSRRQAYDEVDLNRGLMFTQVHARISRSALFNKSRHPNFRDMRRVGTLGFSRYPFSPALAPFYWRCLRNVAFASKQVALCSRFAFATFDTKKPPG